MSVRRYEVGVVGLGILTRLGSLTAVRNDRMASSSSHVMSFVTYHFTSAEDQYTW